MIISDKFCEEYKSQQIKKGDYVVYRYEDGIARYLDEDYHEYPFCLIYGVIVSVSPLKIKEICVVGGKLPDGQTLWSDELGISLDNRKIKYVIIDNILFEQTNAEYFV